MISSLNIVIYYLKYRILINMTRNVLSSCGRKKNGKTREISTKIQFMMVPALLKHGLIMVIIYFK